MLYKLIYKDLEKVEIEKDMTWINNTHNNNDVK